MAGNAFAMIVGFANAVILARLLEPEVFGVFAFVMSVVQVTTAIPDFGLPAAFLHRTGGEKGVSEEILRVYFTLKLAMTTVWAVAMAAGAAVFAPERTRWVFWVVIAFTFAAQQMAIVTVLLIRRVQLRRAAAAQAAMAAASAAVSIVLAARGWGLWALLCGKIAAVAVQGLIFFVIRPVWRPRLGWSRELARFFFGFGGRVFAGEALAQALDRTDDIWTGAALGSRSLGFYDKAFGFATYPRQILSAPLTQVVTGTYSELKDDRPRLSRAFAWVNMLLIRANFWIAGLIWLVAPEFIRLVLGAKWMPMLAAFRLMLVYTLFDPVKGMVANVLVICGAPGRVVRIRAIQLAVMVAGLALLAGRLGIAGVALAVDLMLVTGIVLLYAEVRRFVDFSVRRFFPMPLAAAGLGLAAVRAASAAPGIAGNDWRTGCVKGLVFSTVYGLTLWLTERRVLLEMREAVLKPLRKGAGR
jgi:O-antigen/teichoic acid export membrane protein